MISIPQVFPLIPHLDDGKLKIKVDDLDCIPERNRKRVICADDEDGLVRLKWSLLVAHYEFNHKGINPSLIEFHECGNRVLNIRCKYTMLFREPIECEPGYFLIPGFPGFMINISGIVKSIVRSRALKPGEGPYGYPQVTVYDPDKSSWRNVAIHILLARTFLPNKAIWDKPFVNHKDGIKANLSLSNLEWVTAKENSDHAIDNNLVTDSLPCRMIDHVSGVEVNFRSRSEVKRYLNYRSPITSIYFKACGKVFPRLFEKRYEIRDLSDKEPWYYTTEQKRNEVINSMPPFEMLNISTKEVTVCSSVSDLSRISGVDRALITSAIRSVLPKEVQGYQFREKTDDPWPENPVPTHYRAPSRKIVAICDDSGEVVKVGSTLAATRFFGVDKTTIKRRLVDNKPIGKWRIKEQSQD